MAQAPTVLISGASIAGPALALWLERYGFSVTIVEKASELRRGGQAVDFKGVTHRTVLDRMGILDAVRQAQTDRAGDGAIIDARGRRIAIVPAEFSAGEIEIARGELARILHERTAERCEYVFGDSIASLTRTDRGVEASFARSSPRVFDLVVGADGIHSNVRKIAFGPEADVVQFLGYYYAFMDLEEGAGGQNVMYNEPGRMVMTGESKAPAFFVFKSKPLTYGLDDIDQQKRILIDAFRGGGWKIPALMARVPNAGNFYMDSISRVVADRYADGRVALLGDAAYGNALGGFGTGLAIVGAYVLAGELRRAGGDHEEAFRQYESKMWRYAKVSRAVNGGRVMAPSSRVGLYLRNRMFSVAGLFKGVTKLMDHFATDIELEDYDAGA